MPHTIPPSVVPVLERAIETFALDHDGIHGLSHWARVLENGLRLAERTGADTEVVALFAVLHDSRRRGDGGDDGHGRRAAEAAAHLRGDVVHLSDARFRLLHRACSGHTGGYRPGDVTIATCWDADRLDLPRIGIDVDPDRLCSDEARDPELIAWADRRGLLGVVPAWARPTWDRLGLADPGDPGIDDA